MSYPTKYSRQYDYVSYQNGNPNRPLPADKINADLNQVALSTKEIVDFLKGIARADGKLAIPPNETATTSTPDRFGPTC
jgi:hypothetical protein